MKIAIVRFEVRSDVNTCAVHPHRRFARWIRPVSIGPPYLNRGRVWIGERAAGRSRGIQYRKRRKQFFHFFEPVLFQRAQPFIVSAPT